MHGCIIVNRGNNILNQCHLERYCPEQQQHPDQKHPEQQQYPEQQHQHVMCMMQEFTRQAMASYTPTVASVVDSYVAHWVEAGRVQGYREGKLMALDVAGAVLMGWRCDREELEEFRYGVIRHLLVDWSWGSWACDFASMFLCYCCCCCYCCCILPFVM
jgi:hypothetical protein